MPWLLTFDLAGEMDLFFVRKVSLRKLECINQIGDEARRGGGGSVRGKISTLIRDMIHIEVGGLTLCFDA